MREDRSQPKLPQDEPAESELGPISGPQRKLETYTTKLKQHHWAAIRDEVLDVERTAFLDNESEDTYINARQIESQFMSDNAIVLLLHEAESDKIIGYLLANTPTSFFNEDTAHIERTIIHGDYQGQGLIWDLFEEVHQTLRKMEFEYADIVVTNLDFARALSRRYGERLLDDSYFERIEEGYSPEELRGANFPFLLKL